ncbi:hypothetical protein [Actinomadura sp. CNU-125]|uniref:hypothetical protein n=1 Tax=Actinomadura sp. CNU-125 TaxID=1904961 RepID=UPI001301149E|nr:hypothetical protein [Actinomadura sp. CNU-125]
MPLAAARATVTEPSSPDLAAAVAALTAKVDALQQTVDALPDVVAVKVAEELRTRLVS